jgi:iron(III) transport system ATP-binding protein
LRASQPLAPDAAIAARGLTLRFGETEVLRGIDIDLAEGKTLALLGPSGCGKTTLLRLVAGLLEPSTGSIALHGRAVAGPAGFVPPEKRGLGMVFQDYALWPHLSVAGNVAFPLEMARIPRSEREARVARALDRVGLRTLADRSPAALSGGQQQRVAIARAIVAEPRIVLFDEPLSNLDRELRETMVAELGALIHDLGLTAVYVTHDHSEALSLADQVAVMAAGRIAQLAAPDALIEHPASPQVAEFLRLGTILPLHRVGTEWWLGSRRLASLAGPDQAAARVLVTPNALQVVGIDGATLSGEVIAVHYRDTAYAITLRLAGSDPAQTLQITRNTRMRLGERIGLEIVSERLRWFPAPSEPPIA